MTLWGNMDFRFYDFHVQEYEWDKTNSTLFIICKYQDREKVKVESENPKEAKYLEILPKRIIEYIKHVNDENSDTPCFEIKCKDILKQRLCGQIKYYEVKEKKEKGGGVCSSPF